MKIMMHRKNNNSSHKRMLTLFGFFLGFVTLCNALSLHHSPPPRTYFATCIPGLENALAKEIERIGGHQIEIGKAGVKFTEALSSSTTSFDEEDDFDPLTGTSKSMTVGLKSLLWTRTSHRIMELIATTEGYEDEFPVCNKEDLYSFIQQSCDIKSLLGDGKGGMLSLAVKVTIGSDAKLLPKELCHTHFTALTVKNALVDKCRDMRADGARPDVDVEHPHVPLVVALKGINNGRAVTVSLYRSLNGFDSMHRRGYRTDSVIHKAAMKETMACGLLYECGWHLLVDAAKKDGLPAVLVDPMMGSGTFCIEAALLAADVAPGLMRMRNFKLLPAAVRWKSYDMEVWKHLCQEAQVREQRGRQWLFGSNPNTGERNCRIMGNELNSNAYSLALQNSQRANVQEAIEFRLGNCQDWKIAHQIVEGRTIVVSNPPWGVRLTEDIEESWAALKTFLRAECVGAEAWVLSGNKDVTRFLKMKKTRSVPLNTAAEKLRWLQYHVFKTANRPETIEQ